MAIFLSGRSINVLRRKTLKKRFLTTFACFLALFESEMMIYIEVFLLCIVK